MGATLKLDPGNAVLSLAVRIERIAQDQAYIRETYERYAGLKSFEKRLDDAGIGAAVRSFVKE